MSVKKIYNEIYKFSPKTQTIQKSTSLCHKLFMHLFLDKLVDGLFIFIGVYVAFAFGQCQEDQRKKADLKYYLEDIMTELSTEPPEETAPPFKFTREEYVDDDSGEKSCNLKFANIDMGHKIEKTNLDTIFRDKLSRVIKDKKPLSMLATITYEMQPKLNQANEKFFDTATRELYILVNTKKTNDSKDPCWFNDKKVNTLIESSEKRVQSVYMQTLVYSRAIEKIGYYALKKLKKIGYQARERNKESFSLSIRIDDDYEKKKKERESAGKIKGKSDKELKKAKLNSQSPQI